MSALVLVFFVCVVAVNAAPAVSSQKAFLAVNAAPADVANEVAMESKQNLQIHDSFADKEKKDEETESQVKANKDMIALLQDDAEAESPALLEEGVEEDAAAEDDAEEEDTDEDDEEDDAEEEDGAEDVQYGADDDGKYDPLALPANMAKTIADAPAPAPAATPAAGPAPAPAPAPAPEKLGRTPKALGDYSPEFKVAIDKSLESAKELKSAAEKLKVASQMLRDKTNPPKEEKVYFPSSREVWQTMRRD